MAEQATSPKFYETKIGYWQGEEMANGTYWMALFCNNSRIKIKGVKDLEKTVFNFEIHLHNRQIYLYLHPQKRPRGATE